MTHRRGIVDGLSEDVYHSDPHTLSTSGAKTLLVSPRRYQWERANGSKSSAAMDFGTLCHALTLRSRDKRLAVLPYPDWRTKKAQEAKAEAEQDGFIPVLSRDVRKAIRVAQAVHAHPVAGALLADGRPEVSMFWDEEIPLDDGSSHVIGLRARVDWWHPRCTVDLKTTGRDGGAEPDAFARQAASLDYPMSAAHYTDGRAELTGETVPFITITVETEPPWFVTVSQYHPDDLAAGRARMARAKHEFAARSLSGVWDDTTEIVTLPVPAWYGRTA